MKLLDSESRRIRFAPPQPKGGRIDLTPADYRMFEALHQFGPLSTDYLHAFRGGNYNATQHRLTQLYNGSPTHPPYLARPHQQKDVFRAEYRKSIYDLNQRSLDALAAKPERFDPFVPEERRDHWVHRYMTACASASTYLKATEAGARYIKKKEIFTHQNCPPKTRDAENPLAIPLSGKHYVVPDDFFGIKTSKICFFAREDDRQTESIYRRDISKNSIDRKFRGYIEILRDKIYQKHFGITAFRILILTTNPMHETNLMRHLKSVCPPEYLDKFWFNTAVHFGENWTIPPVLSLYTDPWRRVDHGPAFISSP